MDIKIENWTLFLPIGTIESERLLYLLEFLSSKNIRIVFISVELYTKGNEDLKKLEKASSDGSKRSIASSTERSYLSEDFALSEVSGKNADFAFEKGGKSDWSALNFEKKATEEDVGRISKATISKAQKLLSKQTEQTVQIFLPTLQTDETHFFTNLSDICLILLECFGAGNKLGFLTNQRKSIKKQIVVQESRIDPEVKRLMSFIYLSDIEKDAVVIDSVSGNVSLNWNLYQLSLDNLIKELDDFYKNFLAFTPDNDSWNMSLSEVFLTCSLNRLYKFIFDGMLTKSWLSNITNWFHRVSKRKDFVNAFGKFRSCKVSYTALLQGIDAKIEDNENEVRTEFEIWTIKDWKLKLHALDSNEAFKTGSQSEEFAMLQKFSFGRLNDKSHSLWRFAYIAIDEEYMLRKNSKNAKDEVSEFFDSFCSDATEKGVSFLMYLALTSNCQNLQGFVNAKKSFEPCKTHFGNYFVNSEMKGFAITEGDKMPEFLSSYESKDILEVKEVKESQREWLENIIHRRNEFNFERVLKQRIF